MKRLLEPTDENSQDLPDVSAERSPHAVRDVTPPPVTERPLVLVIERKRAIGLELRDLWAHRELFYFLAWRDVKVRYKQTVLGAGWAILQPLISMVVFTLLFGRLARVPSEGEPYAIFSYAGLLPWNFFTTALTNSSNSLVNSTNLIQRSIFRGFSYPPRRSGRRWWISR